MRRLPRVTIVGTVVLFGMALSVPLVANSAVGKSIVWALSR
jgi:hypothetical protein